MTLPDFQVQHIRDYLQQHNILAAWLYGSYAKGTASQHSDIDLAVLLPEHEDDWQTLPQLNHELSEALNIPVHCISIVKVPTPLAYEAIEGICLFGDAQAMFMEQRIWSKWEEWIYRSKQQ